MSDTWVTLGVILLGVIVVVGGILALRLHAFLALIFGAIVVAVLTPKASIEQYHTKVNSVGIQEIAPDGLVMLDDNSSAKKASKVFLVDMKCPVLRPGDDGRFEEVGHVEIESTTPTAARLVGPGFEVDASRDRVIPPHELVRARSQSRATVPNRVAAGFGDTCAKIGILIAMAAIIGKCLLDSGAADRIVRSALQLFGERGAPAAFMTSGFALGIPVFFDTVFYLMIPLGKALRMRTGRNYLLYVLTIVCGATMAHSLVPPTPGPLFVAEELGVNLGLMILAGSLVGLVTASVGYLFAVFANRMWDLPLRESPDLTVAELEAAARVEDGDLPPLWLSLIPILLPVVLISGQTILERGYFGISASEGVLRIADTLGDKTIALTIAAIIAMATVVWQKGTRLQELSDSIGKALASGGVIILITAAGGAFGSVLRETNVAGLISDLPNMSPAVICATAWLITTAVRTAQGSATVAMITSVGILSDLATGQSLGFDPVYLALAIGCGSKPLAWMNDSGFWVITRMSGMTELEGLKYITPMTAAMGIVGLLVVLTGVSVMPTF